MALYRWTFISVLAVFLGKLFRKLVADICCEKWMFRDRNLTRIIKCYVDENPKRCITMVLLMAVMAFLHLVKGTAYASVAIFFLSFLAQFASCVFPKGHSSVEISQEIEEDKCNIGRTLAINFLINYLDKILPVLPECFETYKLKVSHDRASNSGSMERDAVPIGDKDDEPITVVKKLFILIPKSGDNNYDTLMKADDNMEFVDIVKVASTNISGHKGREYKNTIYRLKDFPMYHFMAEFATPLTAIFHVQGFRKKHSKKADYDQVEIFYNSLVELLDKNKKKYGDMFCPIFYDDTCEDGNQSLPKALRQEVIKKVYLKRSNVQELK